MKFVVVANLIGAAAAFAPAQMGKASIRLHASAVVAQPHHTFVGKVVNLNPVVQETNFNFPQKPVLAPTIIQGLGNAVDRAFSPAYVLAMKVVASIGASKKRSKTCQVVRRRGRLYVIDKKNPRNKARQGGAKMKRWQKGK